jgi:hypothetical protein
MDLTSDPPTSSTMGGPPGVNVTDVRLYLPPQGGLYVLATGKSASTPEPTVFIGRAAMPPCMPSVAIGPAIPFTPTSAEKKEVRARDKMDFVYAIVGAIDPVSVSLTGNVPPNLSASRSSSFVFVDGNAPDAGDYIFTLTITDGRSCKAQLTITLHVVGPRRVVPTMKFIPGKIKVPRAPR